MYPRFRALLGPRSRWQANGHDAHQGGEQTDGANDQREEHEGNFSLRANIDAPMIMHRFLGAVLSNRSATTASAVADVVTDEVAMTAGLRGRLGDAARPFRQVSTDIAPWCRYAADLANRAATEHER